jgi:hypothetical protein
MPTPSMSQLVEATKYICNLTKNKANYNKQNKITACFELSLIVVLLKHLGFENEDKKIIFLSEIDNQKIKWPLGAFMYFEAEEKRIHFQLETDLLAIQVREGLPIGWHLSLFVFFSACFYLYANVYPHSENHWIVKLFGEKKNRTKNMIRTGASITNGRPRGQKMINKKKESIQFIDDASE